MPAVKVEYWIPSADHPNSRELTLDMSGDTDSVRDDAVLLTPPDAVIERVEVLG